MRKSIRLLQEGLGADIQLDHVAQEAGLSRPHFYKLFRMQTGVTPNLYLNTLLMERAIDTLVGGEKPVADIGFDLGFSSQSGFTRFFAANVGMAPSDYRRAPMPCSLCRRGPETRNHTGDQPSREPRRAGI